MSIQPFDHDYWRTERDDWKHLRIRWKCFQTSCDGVVFAKDSDRRDPSRETPPLRVREWLGKPARCLKHQPTTPEDAVDWLRNQFDLYAPQMAGQQATYVDPEVRFGRARYDLQVGNDIVWGFWVNGAATMLSMAVIALPGSLG